MHTASTLAEIEYQTAMHESELCFVNRSTPRRIRKQSRIGKRRRSHAAFNFTIRSKYPRLENMEKTTKIPPIVLHSFFETLHVVHADTLARLHGVYEQTRNAPHFLKRPFFRMLSPPKRSDACQGHKRQTNEQIFGVWYHLVQISTP